MCVSLTLFTFDGKDTRTVASLLRFAVLSWHPNYSYFVFLTKYVKFSGSNFTWLVYCYFFLLDSPRNVSRISGILEVLPEVALHPFPL